MLTVRDLVTTYGKIEALKGVSLEVAASSITCLLGPNGAGKTTLMMTIAGVLKPRRGSIRFEEREIAGEQPDSIVRRGIALVPENRLVFPSMSVLENLHAGAYQRKDDIAADLQRVFDRFPRLKICIGHMGEAVPFWLWRLNFMNTRAQNAGRTRKTKRTMAEYFQDNFVVTNSGVEDPLAMRYSIDKLGIDNVMWAIDYPYQPMEPAVRFIEQFECTDEERHALCHGNAERIFHIGPE